MKQKLDPRVKWKFRFGMYITGAFFLIFIAMFSFFTGAILGGWVGFVISAMIIFFYFLLVVVGGEIWITLSYNRWLYELTTTELKIERGVISKVYKSLPYTRIQNVDIHRGILDRILGTSTIMIHTAGYGMGMAEGYLPGLDTKRAEEIRKKEIEILSLLNECADDVELLIDSQGLIKDISTFTLNKTIEMAKKRIENGINRKTRKI